MTRNFTKQNSLAKPTYPFFTSFCIGLASSCLAASLLLAPCAAVDAQAAMANLQGEGDVLVNYDTITETTTINSAKVGMGTDVVGKDLLNQGSITLTGQTGNIYGMYDFQSANDSIKEIVTNKGSITIDTTGDAYGIYAYASHNGSNGFLDELYIINSGNITISKSKNAYGIYAQTSAYKGEIINISNAGTIDLTGQTAIGIHAYEYSSNVTLGTIKITNDGNILATSSTESCGIQAIASTQIEIYNNSYINVSSTGRASGIMTRVYNDKARSQITNSGTIKVSGTSEAYGIDINDNANGASTNTLVTIYNNGLIDVDSDVNAYGVYLLTKSTQNNAVINNGTMRVSGGTNAIGIFAQHTTGTGSPLTIENRGEITVTGGDITYGIYVGNAHAAVSNYGTINASGASAAHELYVNTGKANIGTWTVTLRDYLDADDNSDPFAVNGGGTINFDGSTFIVTAGTTEEGFAFDKEFPIQDMIHNDGGTIEGAVGIVESAVPFLKAELLHDVVNGADYENAATNTTDTEQTIIIRTDVDTGTSPGHEAEEQIVTGLTQNMNMLCSILDTQLDYDEMPEDWRAFAVPYYTHGVNYDYGYDTDVMGIALGATHRVNDHFSAGVHLNFATIDSESNATTNDALMAGLGVHAKYHVTEDFHIRGQVTGFVMENRLGLSMNAKPEKVMAKVDTTSLGMYAAMFAAYDYKANEHHTFTPEVALKYVFAQHDGYDTDRRYVRCSRHQLRRHEF